MHKSRLHGNIHKKARALLRLENNPKDYKFNIKSRNLTKRTTTWNDQLNNIDPSMKKSGS